ncbi:MAG: VOC family protein [Proteobacteria bacterium]|nr:VOC family protein [Pseudomonadota bacterium]
MAGPQLSAVTFLVRDYDEAIAWFTQALGFLLLEDSKLGENKRWVRLAASEGGTCLLLAKAEGSAQQDAIGHAAGGRVAYFLSTSDFHESYARMQKAQVRFREEPRHEPYGTVAVFEDLYGNAWDLIQPATVR